MCRLVVATREAHPELGVKTACDLVADAALEKGLLLTPYRDTFVNSLRVSYNRYLKSPEKERSHGNKKLTNEEEDFLVGVLDGLTLSGGAIGKTEIIETAEVIFPDMTFGDTWYENFTETYKGVLTFGRTKSTLSNRTSTATLDSTMVFIDHLKGHHKSTFPFAPS